MSATLLALVVGAVLGFVLSVPAAGPLLALVVLAGARGDTRRALALAVGGALAESGWAALAFWGLSQLITARAELIPVLRGFSALLLISLAIVLWTTASAAEREPDDRRRVAPAALGFLLVALNPGFPLTWGGVAAALYSSRWMPPVPALALGVFVGIVAWFTLVARLAARVGKRFEASARRRWSRAVALMLLALAAWLALLALRARV